MLGIIIPGAAVVIVVAMLIIVKTSDKEHRETQEHLSAMQAVVTAGLLGAVAKPKPRTETVNGTSYIFREHWWFQQYPINDEISLELCVGYGVEWIEGLRPKREPTEYGLSSKYVGAMPYVVSNISEKMNRLEERIQEVNQEAETREIIKESIDGYQARYDTTLQYKDLQLAMAQCCCTTNADRTRQAMEMCCQTSQSRIDELRWQLCEQQMQARSAEMYNRIPQVAPPLPVHPPSAYQTYYQAGYRYGQWMQ